MSRIRGIVKSRGVRQLQCLTVRLFAGMICRRSASRPSHARDRERRAVLHHRHSLHRHAPQAECPRGYCARCTSLPSVSFTSYTHAWQRSIPAPPPRPKICSPDDIITLEDESGRVTLVGERLKSAQLVTGVVIAALGMETSGGEFEVIDVCFAGMAPQPGMDRSWGDVRNMKKPEDDSMDVDSECIYCRFDVKLTSAMPSCVRGHTRGMDCVGIRP